ncbi:hypothetical protein BLA29_006850 [Euroglyphus maynei]|uniref:Uncharacterized protein n=1 Tax=Euroglyphus maynei TaxID=6958 RepID=A0A1Y3BQB1_EURMA|nr:hypothetical protein BLA29_006850 [Euroglyphus maynei]
MHPTTLILLSCIVISLAITVIGDNYHDWPVPPKSPNFRQEYDQLLFGFVEDNIYRSERKMILLADHYEQYLKSMTYEISEFILEEVHNEITILEHTQNSTKEYFQSRDDWSPLESYIGEKMQDEVYLLLKYFRRLRNAIERSQPSTPTNEPPTDRPTTTWA